MKIPMPHYTQLAQMQYGICQESTKKLYLHFVLIFCTNHHSPFVLVAFMSEEDSVAFYAADNSRFSQITLQRNSNVLNANIKRRVWFGFLLLPDGFTVICIN